MSSPRKYASPYLTGLPGLPGASGAVKSKKKSKTSITTKLSDSAAAVKQIQDGIWQSAKDAASKASEKSSNMGDQPSPREDTSFDDASSCGGIAVEKFLDEIKEVGMSELTTSDDAPEGLKLQGKVDEENEGDANIGASALVSSKDSMLLKQGSSWRSPSSEEENELCWSPPPPLEEYDEEITTAAVSVTPSSPELKSILKKPSKYSEKTKKEPTSKKPSKSVPKSKYGRPVKEPRDLQGPGLPGRVLNKLGSVSNLEVHNKFSNNNISKTVIKSPRKKSKVNGNQLGTEQDKGSNLYPPFVPESRKNVRFSNRVDVHIVPYEPRAGSRACDWQRNMLEQRVQTFRQLMKEVGNSEDIDLFGNSMLFPGYSTYHVPNPKFALRGANGPGIPLPPGLIGLQGIGRARKF